MVDATTEPSAFIPSHGTRIGDGVVFRTRIIDNRVKNQLESTLRMVVVQCLYVNYYYIM